MFTNTYCIVDHSACAAFVCVCTWAPQARSNFFLDFCLAPSSIFFPLFYGLDKVSCAQCEFWFKLNLLLRSSEFQIILNFSQSNPKSLFLISTSGSGSGWFPRHTETSQCPVSTFPSLNYLHIVIAVYNNLGSAILLLRLVLFISWLPFLMLFP